MKIYIYTCVWPAIFQLDTYRYGFSTVWKSAASDMAQVYSPRLLNSVEECCFGHGPSVLTKATQQCRRVLLRTWPRTLPLYLFCHQRNRIGTKGWSPRLQENPYLT
ncbi:hypothetical protein SKAU_G00104940 [Synaphobranchus kaupii]|uniref:Uncharacterized protein n=1 Tax=Synaphobranchus kaupii TaxID=118154 RepID=A0A9Q1FZB0_SYNKA|nr:hypothetical protein SKAU_G00104940 [Synaphobranchus kaupii]